MSLILGGLFLILQIDAFPLEPLRAIGHNLSPVLITTGILVFCFGLFGELIAFANAKQVKDYTVETFLNF